MTRTKITNPSGNGGLFDDKDLVYETFRDYAQGQVFFMFGNALAISSSNLRKLASKGCKTIEIIILNFPGRDKFKAVIGFQEFLQKSEIIEYSKKYNGDRQRRLKLSEFKIVEFGQKKLGEEE